MSRVSNTLDFLKNCALVVLLLAIGVAYHPTIIRMSRAAGYESGTILSRYIVILFCVVFALSLFTPGLSLLKSKVIRTTLFSFLLIGVTGLITIAFFDNSHVIADLKSLIIVFGAMIIGIRLTPSRHLLYILFLTFSAGIVFSGVSQVMVNIGGFTIEDQYLTDAKNSLGALLASVTILSLFVSHDTHFRIVRLLAIVGVILGLLLILVIRARMAFFATVILFVFYFYLRSRSRHFLVTLLILIPILIIVFLLLPDSVFNFVGASMTAGTQGEDFTSGRMGTYREAVALFLNNPLMGNIRQTEHIAWVHNYPLLKLSSFGILFSWPVLFLYCYILWQVISRSFQYKGSTSFANLFLLVPFIISMAEPTFPFGPGTVTIFNFILFGMADRAITTDTQLVSVGRHRT